MRGIRMIYKEIPGNKRYAIKKGKGIKSFLLINAKNNDFSLGLILGKKDDVIEVFNWVNSKEIIDKIKDIKLHHTTTMILFNS